MTMKKVSGWILIAVLAISLVACNAEETSEGEPGTEQDVVKEGEKVVVNFWHAMGGSAGDALEEIVEKYNDGQEDVQVNLIYQGSYEEGINKLKTVAGTDEAPTIMQIYEIGTRYMIDSGDIKPIQDFIDADNYDISQFEENILGYYTVNDQLYSMPFNSSNAIMFYNKDAFEEAGLDPDNPPHTYSEIKDAAEKLTISDGSTTERYGFSILVYGWFFEQLMANQGAGMVNNENGRAEPATEAVFNGEEGQRVFEWLQEMYNDGVLGNFGRNWDDIRTAFKSEKVAMYLDSTAATAANIEDTSFEVGTAYIPVPDGMDPQGVIVGGGSLWMMDGVPEETQQAAWDFTKFLLEPENQAFWSVSTGYFPVTKEAYDEEILKDNLEEFPQFQTSIDQLHNTTLSPATQGALIGVFPEVRTNIEDQIERLYDGSVEPKEALDIVAEKVDKALDNYNKTSGQDSN